MCEKKSKNPRRNRRSWNLRNNNRTYRFCWSRILVEKFIGTSFILLPFSLSLAFPHFPCNRSLPISFDSWPHHSRFWLGFLSPCFSLTPPPVSIKMMSGDVPYAQCPCPPPPPQPPPVRFLLYLLFLYFLITGLYASSTVRFSSSGGKWHIRRERREREISQTVPQADTCGRTA